MRLKTNLLLLITLPLVCGLFGMLHNQISCTVSKEYFTLFKFDQFGFEVADGNGPLRMGAATVGFLASWWMGIPAILLFMLTSMRIPDHVLMRSYAKATAMALSIALGVGICGLAYGSTWDTAPDGWYLPAGVKDRLAFATAGSMHNFSYLGGVLGMAAANIMLYRQGKRTISARI